MGASIDPRLWWQMNSESGGAMPALDPSAPPPVPSFGPMPSAPPAPPAEDAPPPLDPAYSPAHLDTPEVAPPKKGFLQKLVEGLYHVPDGAADQMTPGDLHSMRQRALLAAGASMATGTDDVIPAVLKGLSGSQTMFSNEVSTHLKQLRESTDLGSLMANKSADAIISAKYPAPANESVQDKIMRLTQMATDYAALGSTDRAKAMADAVKNLKAMAGGASSHVGHKLQHINAGSYFTLFDPEAVDGLPYLKRGGDPKNPDDWRATLDNGLAIDQNNRRWAQFKQSTDEFHIKELDHQYEQFMKDPQVDQASSMYSNFSTLKTVLKQAKKNGSATVPLTGQLAAFVDPKARLVLGMMKYLEDYNPALVERFRRFVSIAATGRLPANQLDDINELVDDIEGTLQNNYEKRRKYWVRSHATLDGIDERLPKIDELFDSTARAEPTAPGAGVPNWTDPDAPPPEEH